MSWDCCKCGEENADEFLLCWNCGCDIDGVPWPMFAKHSNRPSAIEVPERPPPRPFRERLNGYFHRDADESIPKDTFRSRMPFWLKHMQLTLSPPKPIEHIRKLLKRIHELVQSSRPKS